MYVFANVASAIAKGQIWLLKKLYYLHLSYFRSGFWGRQNNTKNSFIVAITNNAIIPWQNDTNFGRSYAPASKQMERDHVLLTQFPLVNKLNYDPREILGSSTVNKLPR